MFTFNRTMTSPVHIITAWYNVVVVVARILIRNIRAFFQVFLYLTNHNASVRVQHGFPHSCWWSDWSPWSHTTQDPTQSMKSTMCENVYCMHALPLSVYVWGVLLFNSRFCYIYYTHILSHTVDTKHELNELLQWRGVVYNKAIALEGGGGV